MKIDLSGIGPFFTINFTQGFDDYYVIEQEVDISELKLQEEEVQDVRWADKEDVLRMESEGTMIPYWFMDKLFETREFYDGAHSK